jgi:UDP-N-acetylglucosamine diphosphorylase/glucosamine-1-phosphate N-acetyltransferase
MNLSAQGKKFWKIVHVQCRWSIDNGLWSIIIYFAYMAIILFDNSSRNSLLPLTYTKAVADLRFGILSIRERWETVSRLPVFVHTGKYLQPLYALPGQEEHLWIDASVIPGNDLLDRMLSLDTGCCIADEKGLIAGKAALAFEDFDPSNSLAVFQNITDHAMVKRIEYPWQLMQWNDPMIRSDYVLITNGRISQPIPSSVNVLQPENIFIEEGAKLSFCTLNASTGPVYIGKKAEIMEGSVIRGPFALGENSVLKLNSRVYGATTLGPSCMGGGEIKNTVMMGYSNKAHDGYLGDSVVGEWCNFGAGSTNSNIKNTAGEIRVWDMDSKQYLPVGVIIGDYSRVAINSSINTGSVIGVSCNVFGAGLLPTIVPNFSWGAGGTKYEFEKALVDINNWKKLKDQSLSEGESSVLQYIFGRLAD